MHLANLAMMGDLSPSAFTYLVARSNCQRTNIHDIFALNLVGIIKFVGANLGTHRSHYRFALITENEGRVELLVDTRLCDVDIECQSRNLFSTMKGIFLLYVPPSLLESTTYLGLLLKAMPEQPVSTSYAALTTLIIAALSSCFALLKYH